LPFQIIPAAAIEEMMKGRIKWHDRNLSDFVAKWKSYVEPNATQADPARAAHSCVDNQLPE
jgi:hypothetical protein